MENDNEIHDYTVHMEPTQNVCPSCGYCPHCGRGGQHMYPVYPGPYLPPWQPQTPTWPSQPYTWPFWSTISEAPPFTVSCTSTGSMTIS